MQTAIQGILAMSDAASVAAALRESSSKYEVSAQPDERLRDRGFCSSRSCDQRRRAPWLGDLQEESLVGPSDQESSREAGAGFERRKEHMAFPISLTLGLGVLACAGFLVPFGILPGTGSRVLCPDALRRGTRRRGLAPAANRPRRARETTKTRLSRGPRLRPGDALSHPRPTRQ